MMGRFALLALVGCGRIGFDGLSSAREIDATISIDATPDAAVVPAGPKIWLRMETDPTIAIIDSAGGHVTTCDGACPTTTIGIHGGGYAFTMQDLSIAYAPDLDASAGFTAAAWVKIDSIPSSEACLFSKPYNVAMSWDMFVMCIETDGTYLFDGESDVGVTDQFSSPIETLHVWHHMAFVWDGTTKRGYVDGTLINTAPIAIGSSTDYLSVGGGHGGGFYLDGDIDDVIYYTRALTPAEVTQLATP